MKIVKDNAGDEWEVYMLKPWSFVLLIPVGWNLAFFLGQGVGIIDLPLIDERLLAAGVIAFLISNFDYLYAARTVGYDSAGEGEPVTYRRAGFKIYIRRSKPTDSDQMF